jgi:hypothetical protein
MPKYLLFKHYRGGPEPRRPVPPMDRWAPEDVEEVVRIVVELRWRSSAVDSYTLTGSRVS